ncbi:MAG: TonB-dependent receptor, partial [Chitinophagales bacterium]|nr:TonB-dependent receptor [Chitinophagales bacterium]
DGPFDRPQNLNRINLLGKYRTKLPGGGSFGLQTSMFSSKWDASGQIPERAVNRIERFGAIDSTEGGETSRINVTGDFKHFLSDQTYLKGNFYYSRYLFELYSNFTFYLRDSINGDQIRQKEARNLTGFTGTMGRYFTQDNLEIKVEGSIGVRYDAVDDSELSYTTARKNTLENVRLGDIFESNLFASGDAVFTFSKWTVNTGLRMDYFKFDYYDKLLANYETRSVDKIRFSPKLNVMFSPANRVQLFIKTGLGFHSNDTRVIIAKTSDDIVPIGAGIDIGLNLKPINKLFISVTGWYLYLEQEFVYVGDEGIIEPSGKTSRLGVDIGLRYQPKPWLFLDADANYAYARAIDENKGQDYIPLAPVFTSTFGVSVKHKSGFSTALRGRYIYDRPANEDYSSTAEGYFIVDANASYTYKLVVFSLSVENLFNTEWKETQFLTESKLYDEDKSVEEIHFTPGFPISVKGKLAFKF